MTNSNLPENLTQEKNAPISWGKIEAHEEKLRRRISTLYEKGRKKDAFHLVKKYMSSFSCCLLAVREATKDLPKAKRPSFSEMQSIAKTISVSGGSDEKAKVYFKEKDNDPNDFRPIMSFGIKNKSLQIMIKKLLEDLATFHPCQYAIHRGHKAAAAKAMENLQEGYLWVIEIDIKNFFQAFNTEKALELLPLPKEVTSKVVPSEHYDITWDLSTIFDKSIVLPGEDSDTFLEACFPEDLAKVRQGIPQGSSASSIVAEVLLASVFPQLPDCGVVVNYVDNFLVMAREESEVGSMVLSLMSALEKHPAGPLLVKGDIKVYPPGKEIKFLGYSFKMVHGKYRAEPTSENLFSFKAKFSQKLKSIKSNKTSKKRRKKEIKTTQFMIRSWSAAFSLWEGAESFRERYLKTLENAC